MRRFVVTLGAIVPATALLMGPFAPSGAVAAPAPGLHGQSHGLHAGPPDAPGRYAVGLSTVRMVDPARADRTLTVDIWYPADRRSDAPTASLDLVFTRLALPGVLAGAEAAKGSFPLVVFSHGNGGVRFQSWFLMQALASHGFVVAAPDHAGNTALDAIAGTSDPVGVAAANRPRDVSFVIDQMVARDRDAGGSALPADRRGRHRGRRPLVRRVHGAGVRRWVRRLPARPAGRRHRADRAGDVRVHRRAAVLDRRPHAADGRDVGHGGPDRARHRPGLGPDIRPARVPGRPAGSRAQLLHQRLRHPRRLRGCRGGPADPRLRRGRRPRTAARPSCSRSTRRTGSPTSTWCRSSPRS